MPMELPSPIQSLQKSGLLLPLRAHRLGCLLLLPPFPTVFRYWKRDTAPTQFYFPQSYFFNPILASLVDHAAVIMATSDGYPTIEECQGQYSATPTAVAPFINDHETLDDCVNSGIGILHETGIRQLVSSTQPMLIARLQF